MIWLILYGLVAAVVFGWLLRAHLTAEHPSDGVPRYVLFGIPLCWLPLLAIYLIVGTGWVIKLFWTRRGGW